ncbi:MAG: CFI-box-CTERM domain-containing protein [Candidatus Nitrosotenuis sp.]
MRFLLLSLVLLVAIAPAFAELYESPTDKGTLLVRVSTEPEKPVAGEQAKVKISFVNPQTKEIQQHIDYKVLVTNGDDAIFRSKDLEHTGNGEVTIPMELKAGQNKISIDILGIFFREIPTETVSFVITAENPAQTKSGCLIATAAYGTELAPQVQSLREIRDSVLFGTNSGTTFMVGFNEFYYSFSPTISDLERQSPLFKEMVKTSITPMLSSLSILQLVDIHSESQMLGYGVSIILLNIGMYFVAPAIVILKLYKQKSE